MRSTIVALVAAMLVATSPAFAGGGAKGDVELGIYGGYAWLDDYGIFHPKNGPLYGARLGYFFTPNWSLEASAQRISTKTEFDIVGAENVDVHLDAIRLNLLYNFRPGEEIRPFLTAGYGYEVSNVEGFGSSCDWGWNAGGGLRWFPSPHWNIRADGRYVSTKVSDEVDETQNNVEATLGLSWLFGGTKTEAVESASTEAPPNQRPTVSCASDRAEILPGESVSINATASDPEGDPLTYEWSTTAGRVSGAGPTATFNFAGTTPPASATVTVRVSDNHGNSSTCNAAVSLREPVRQAEAVSCVAGGFPRNLSRVNNVDKACLDDVAQRLGADPRAHVIIIGHADSHESSRDVAQRRADALKDYLVKERGIEASRITTRSAGADTGADAAAQASNRRVEVWFVPEGATEPK
jgi:outer membrane protein OmpA-like peptidoglycan-associated protein/opacity protein-like surface antigen